MTNKERFYDAVDRGRDGKNIGLSMGLPKLESFIDGYLPETSYLVGGMSGTGKSSFTIFAFIYKPLMAYLSGKLQSRDPYWCIFSLEMTPEQIYSKLISLYIYENFGEQISFKELFSRGEDCILSDDRYDLVKACDDFLSVLDERLIFYEGTLNAEKYRKTVMEFLERFGQFKGDNYVQSNPDRILGVMIDHLSLVRASAGRSKKEEMDLISSYSVQFRNKCRISPIHVMQFNRDAGNQERVKQGLQEPSYNDFKDSGAMVEDSHIVLGLHAPIKHKLSSYRKYSIKELGQNFIAAVLLKSRFGTSDIIDPMAFYGNISLYKELPRADEINDYGKYKNPDWTLTTDNESTSNIKITL